MKFSYKWLCDYIDIGLTADELADRLTLAGHEVEGIDHIGANIKGIITGKIESIEKHPDADRLVITQIFDGKNRHQIVTGANNISEGDIVPVSLPGAVIASGMELKATKLRGVDSFGMLCSETELGVSDEAAGIWILPEDTPIGVDFVEYAQLQDSILDVSILPNRRDCMSIYGLAREISAILDIPLKSVDTSYKTEKSDNSFAILVESPTQCPYYLGHFLKDIKNEASPLWMVRRLELMGIRSISLTVDITNYVLLEMGQPFHAFDLDKLSSTTVRVCQAQNGQTLTTLDEQERKLTENDLLICDDSIPIAISGVMGGASTEVTEDTQNIFLESAFFDPVSIRRTANRLALRTESAIRFEKTLDIEGITKASDRALHLFQKLGNATVLRSESLFKNPTYSLYNDVEIPFNAEEINSLLGTQIEEKVIKNALGRLGIEIKGKKAIVPSWRRHDLEEMPCIAEEVSRLVGFDEIPSTLPQFFTLGEEEETLTTYQRQLTNFFVANGFAQTNTFTLISESDIESCSLTKAVPELQNPLTVEESFLRPDMLPSLLKVAKHNYTRQMNDIRLFESGNVYWTNTEGSQQRRCISGIFIGNTQDKPYTQETIKSASSTFFHVKGLVENALQSLKVTATFNNDDKKPYLHPQQQAQGMYGKDVVAVLGKLHPLVAKAYDIVDDVYYFCIELETISKLFIPTPQYKSIPKFPWTRRDIAFLAPKSLSFSEIEAAIRKYKPKLVKEFYLFDLFESESIGADKRSLGVAFIYQNPEDTLSDDKVNKSHDRFSQFLLEQLPISIR